VKLQVTFRNKLKLWRKSKDLSQEEAAEHLGVPTGTLQGWEQGRHQPTDLAMGAIVRIIARYPIAIADREKYNNKEIEFRKLLITEGPKAGSLVSGKKGRLLISTNGTEGSAEIHADEWDGDHIRIKTTVINLPEVAFRSITPLGNGFLLDWSGRR
jgi:transcriptional regulator with XRE-family HTH domain